MLELRTLGPMDLRTADGRPVGSVLAQPKRMALLSYLVLEGRGGFVRRDLLLAAFWPEADGERGRASLRRSLHFLRAALGADVIVARGDAVAVPSDALWCDAVALQVELDAGHLTEGVTLYRGDLLAGLHLRDGGDFERWMEGERDLLRSRVGEALWALAGQAVERGDDSAAASFSARAVALAPYDEGSQRRRIALLLDGGDHAGALHAYDEFAAWLAREYRGTPSEETRRLADRLRSDPPLVSSPRALPESARSSRRTDGTKQDVTTAAGATNPEATQPVTARSETTQTERLHSITAGSRATEARATEARATEARATEARATEARATESKAPPPKSVQDEAAEATPLAPASASSAAPLHRSTVAPIPDPSRKAFSEPASNPRPKINRRLVWKMVILLALAGGGAVALLPRQSPPPAATVTQKGDVRTLLVLPFAVRGGERFDYLEQGLVDLLSTQLDGIGPLQTIDPNALLGRIPTLDGSPDDPLSLGRAASKAFGADFFVAGSVVQAGGDRLELRASLYGSDGALITTAAAGAVESELIRAVDELGRQLLLGRYDGPGQELTRLAVRTTSSLPALRAHLTGNQLLREGRFGDAADSQRVAVATDPAFALAHYGLSMALGWLSAGADREATVAAEEAVKRAGRLGERVSSTLRAHHASWNGSPDEAERLYRQILNSYPDDVDARNGLAEVIFHEGAANGRPLGDAAKEFERVVSVPALRMSALLHLARIAAVENDSLRLDSMIVAARREPSVSAGDGRMTEMEALWAFARGDAVDRRTAGARVSRQSDAQRWQLAWSVARFTGDWSAAESLLTELASPDRAATTRAVAWLGVATLRAAGGRPEAARAALAAAAHDDPEWAALARAELDALPFFPASAAEVAAARQAVFLTARLSRPAQGVLAPGFTASFRDLAHRRAIRALDQRGSSLPEQLVRPLSATTTSHLSAPMADSSHLAGALASLERQWANEAIGQLPFLPGVTLQRLRRGHLLEKQNQRPAARRWYASIPTGNGYDVQLIAPAVAHRARLAEGEGSHAEAAQLYERFAVLWADCEPELRPAVNEALRRAARLRGIVESGTASRNPVAGTH